MNEKLRAAPRNKAETLTTRDKQALRFLRWIKRYSGWWYLICTPGDEHMNLDMMKMLVQRLAQEEFYEIIPMLLMIHRAEPFMDSVFQQMLLELALSCWEGGKSGRERILKELADLLT